jgi:hypothetical protein
MKKRIFKFNAYRIFSLWIVPLILLAFMILVFQVDRKSMWNMKPIELVAWCLFLVFSVGIFSFLFFNHLSFASKSRVIFENESIEVIQKNKVYTVRLADIQKVVEYSIDNKYTSGKLPWGSLMKWKIVTANEEVYISSLTISKDDFKKYINKELTYNFSYLPMI